MINPKPKNNMSFEFGFAFSSSITATSPLKAGKNVPTIKGNKIQTNEGKPNLIIKCSVVTLFAIQSIVVVTSPIGVQAPPAFAAMIIKPAYHIRSS